MYIQLGLDRARRVRKRFIRALAYLLRTLLVVVVAAENRVTALGRMAESRQIYLRQFRNLPEEAGPGGRFIRRYPVAGESRSLTPRFRLRIVHARSANQQLRHREGDALGPRLRFRS